MAIASRAADKPLPCEECEAPVEPGQRYCPECGARRGPLSPRVSGTIGALFERGRAPVEEPTDDTAPADDELAPNRLRWGTPLGSRLPTPRAALLAVTGMLGFGVILGSLGNVSVQTLASAPSLLLNLPGGGSSSSSGGGSGPSSGGSPSSNSSSGSGASSGSSQGSGSSSSSGSSGASTGSTGNGGTSGPSGFNGLPPIQNVFLIVLSQQGYNQTFNPAGTDSYFNKTLVGQGELIQNYYAVAGSPLANEIALLSGQGPTQQTAANCPSYTVLSTTGRGSHGQVLGDGCVYPKGTKTLMDELTAYHKTWRAYIEGMPSACSHPKLGGDDAGPTSTEHPYAAWTNPFVFFQSIVASKDCRRNDVGLGQLKADLKKASKTPSFAYIAPSPCDDGSDQPCTPGAASGLGPADRFLRTVVPEIRRSPAYKSGGLIAITFDEAPQTGANADSNSCCGQPTFPNMPSSSQTSTTPTTTTSTTPTSTTPTTTTSTTPTSTTTTTDTTTSTTTTPSTPPGGGQVGLLLISKWVKPNNPDPIDTFNHFSLLKGIEQLFGLRQLGYAGTAGLLTWTSSVFSGPGP